MSDALNVRESNQPISDLVNGPAVAVDARATLRQVAARLGDLGIGLVVVMEEGRLVGVVSERDLVWAIAREADLDLVWAADVMTLDVDVVRVEPEASVIVAAATMAANNARHLIVDYPDAPAVVSIRDVMQRLVEG